MPHSRDRRVHDHRYIYSRRRYSGRRTSASTPPPTKRLASAPTLIRHATVLTGTGTRLDGADVLLVDGKIQAVGTNLQAPANARVVEGDGLWVTPGLIDVHSHLGVYAEPAGGGQLRRQRGDLAEYRECLVRAFRLAAGSGLPDRAGRRHHLAADSARLGESHRRPLGGVEKRPQRHLPGHEISRRAAGAENGLRRESEARLRRGANTSFPSTRMGNMAGYRAQWVEAQEYLRDQEEYQQKLAPAAPRMRSRRSAICRLDTLAAALKGDIIVHMHCYRADEMATVLDMSQEFGYHVAAFHHAVEAYKIADLLAENGVCAAMWADWWGFKMEAYDGIPENIAFVDAAPDGCAIVHSDSEEGIQRLNQEAAKAIAYGARAGFDIPPERAIRWLTANPAKVLGVLDRTGHPGAGKDGGRGGLEPQSVQRVCAGESGVHRRGRAVRPREPGGRARIGLPHRAAGGPGSGPMKALVRCVHRGRSRS